MIRLAVEAAAATESFRAMWTSAFGLPDMASSWSGSASIDELNPTRDQNTARSCRWRNSSCRLNEQRAFHRPQPDVEDVTPLADLLHGHTGRAGARAPTRLRRFAAALQCRLPRRENIQACLPMHRGRHEQAWRQLVADNPFAAIHGRVCYHPCETVCNRAHLDSWCRSIRGAVPRRPRSRAGLDVQTTATRTGKRVLVIGGAERTVAATIWRASATSRDPRRGRGAGGMMRYGIPSYRLPRDVLDVELNRIAAMASV